MATAWPTPVTSRLCLALLTAVSAPGCRGTGYQSQVLQGIENPAEEAPRTPFVRTAPETPSASNSDPWEQRFEAAEREAWAALARPEDDPALWWDAVGDDPPGISRPARRFHFAVEPLETRYESAEEVLFLTLLRTRYSALDRLHFTRLAGREAEAAPQSAEEEGEARAAAVPLALDNLWEYAHEYADVRVEDGDGTFAVALSMAPQRWAELEGRLAALLSVRRAEGAEEPPRGRLEAVIIYQRDTRRLVGVVPAPRREEIE